MMREKNPPYAGLGLEWLVAAVPEALLIVGSDGMIEHANLSAAHMFGYALDEIVGADVEALVPVRFRSAHAQMRKDYDRSPYDRPMGGSLEISAVRRDGSEFLVEIELRPRHTAEGTMTIAVLRDRETKTPEDQASETATAAKQDSEIWQLLAGSEPLLSGVIAFLTEVLVDANSRHREGGLPDDTFVQIRRLATTARTYIVDLQQYIEANESRNES